MIRRSGKKLFVLALVTCVGISACQAPALDAGSAEALVRQEFPAAEVEIRDVQVRGEEAVAAADFDGMEVSFHFVRDGDGWRLRALEEDGLVHTVEDLRRISETMATMRYLATALGTYEVDQGEYPGGDAEEMLQALAPDYYPPDRFPGTDAWGRPFSYASQGADYTLISAGPDGNLGTRDDIVLVSGVFVEADEG